MPEPALFHGHRASRRQIWIADVAAGAWIAAWIAVAVVVAIDVHRLASLADTEANAAVALQQVAGGLDVLSHIPIVGGDLGKLASSVGATARSAKANATVARSSITQLSWLLGFVIAIAPAIPILALYVPFRWTRVRDVRALRAALRRPGAHDDVIRYLAARALTDLPYGDLLRLSKDPWRDFAEGDFAALANAEAERLGLGPLQTGTV